MGEEFDPTAADEGPYVNAAILCERVLQETDGVVSAIRIIDQSNIPMPSDTPKDTMVISPFTGALLIVLKGGRRGSEHEVVVVGHSPTGEAQTFPPIKFTLASRVPEAIPGLQIVAPVQLLLQHEGVYWFEVRLDGRRVTATPLQTVFVPSPPRSELLPPPPSAESQP